MKPAAPKRRSPGKRPVQLNLRRKPAVEEDLEERSSPFWRWVAVIALAHMLVIAIIGWLYRAQPPVPADQFISLLPQGDVVKGEPGAPQAPKVGQPSTVHSKPSQAAPKPVAPPKPVTPPEPKPTPQAVTPPTPVQPPKPVPAPTPPKSIVPHADAPVVPPKPVVKPAPPKPEVHKVKVDLHLVENPDAAPTDTPAKPHPKKPATKPSPPHETSPSEAASTTSADEPGLSREEVAAKLGEKLKQAGVDHSTNFGPSGSRDGKANNFSAFYASLRDQVMNKWPCPNVADETVVSPEVRIHVDRDGRVPPESVTLIRSSGNATYDNSALAAARSIGYTLEPLPDGCPPDISINFKLTR